MTLAEKLKTESHKPAKPVVNHSCDSSGSLALGRAISGRIRVVSVRKIVQTILSSL